MRRRQHEREGNELNNRIERFRYSKKEKAFAAGEGGRLEIFAAGVIANVAWNAICSRDVGFSFDDSRYPRYTCPWQIARETVRINCLHERRRRLHTHSMATSNRAATEHSPPFFHHWPPAMRSCEYLVTVNYTRYRFIFCWQIRATIPWVLPPILFFFFPLSARRSSAVWRARFVCKMFKRAPPPCALCLALPLPLSTIFVPLCACVSRILSSGTGSRLISDTVSSLPVGNTCFNFSSHLCIESTRNSFNFFCKSIDFDILAYISYVMRLFIHASIVKLGLIIIKFYKFKCVN